MDASASDNATAYRYDKFGNGDFGPWTESETRSFTYDGAGTYEPQVRVRSPADFTDTASCGTLTVEANNPPTADFSYSPAEPAPGENVSFVSEATDEDGDVVQYLWTVDGEPVGEAPELTYTFEESGDYLVELTVTDDDGATDTASTTVTVAEENQPPTLDISYNPQQPEPDEQVTFTVSASDADGEVVEFTWHVDGEPIVTTPDREFGYVFDEPGDHTVAVVAEDDDGATARASQTVTVRPAENEPPTAEFTFSPTEPPPGEMVTFEAQVDDPDGDVVDYEWTIDGEVIGKGLSIGYGFQEPGDHHVVLTVTDDDGATATAERTVIVEADATTETPTATAAEPVELTADWWTIPLYPLTGETTTFVAAGARDPMITYRWDMDDDGDFEKEGKTVVYSFEEPGRHTVNLRAVVPNGKTKTNASTVSVQEESIGGSADRGPLVWTVPQNPRPGEPTTLIADSIPSPDEVEAYRWDLDGDGEYDKRGEIITHTFNEAGLVSVNLSIERPNGSSVVLRESVVISGPTLETERTVIDRTPITTETTYSTTKTGDRMETTTASNPGLGFIVALVALTLAIMLFARRAAG